MNRHDAQLEAMERDARLALFYQDQLFEIAVCEHQRHAGEAVNQALRESSEHYEVMMMQEFQCIQTHMKDDCQNMKEGWHS